MNLRFTSGWLLLAVAFLRPEPALADALQPPLQSLESAPSPPTLRLLPDADPEDEIR